LEIEGFEFDCPPGFTTESATVAMRMRVPGVDVVPSLVIQSRAAPPGVKLSDLAISAINQIARSVQNIKDPSHGQINFDDGAEGVLLSYGVRTERGEVHQYYALRLEGERYCTLAMTFPTANLKPATHQLIVKAIASIRPASVKA
jgi:hypothetical protein